MVRFFHLRHRRGPRLQRSVLSQIRSGGRHARGFCYIRRRICRPPVRRVVFRPFRRPARPQADAGRHPIARRYRHLSDRAPADLCTRRRLGAGGAGGAAPGSGLRCRRGIRRSRDLCRRICAARQAGRLWQLGADRRRRRQLAGRRGLRARQSAAAREIYRLGLAAAVPDLDRADRSWALCPRPGRRNPDFHRSGRRARSRSGCPSSRRSAAIPGVSSS